MSDADQKTRGWKQKLIQEFRSYLLNVVYLFLFLGMFTMYRRLILAQYQISYLNYGASLFEAMVLGKIIMIGDALRLSRGMEHRPLILPTLHKTIIFSILVGLFSIIEHMVIGRIRGQPLGQGFTEMITKKKYELIAECLVTFMAFIPFFGMRELARTLGKGKMQELFFGARARHA